MKLSRLKQYFVVDKLIYHSIDLSLYYVTVVIDAQEYPVLDESGQRLTGRNLLSLQKQLADIHCKNHVLRHSSPYDEMIGGPEKGDNSMEVPLGRNDLY